jgi:hypothetical protein
MKIVKNKTPKKPRGVLEQSFASKLKELLGTVPWLQGWRVELTTDLAGTDCNLVATVPFPGNGTATLRIVCKRELRPSQFPVLAAKPVVPHGNSTVVVPVLALPWVSPRLADLCRVNGWSWFDLTGNYLLDVPGLLHLEHTGNKPEKNRASPSAANLGTPEAGRVVLSLLLPANAGKRWLQMDLQEECRPPVSLGLVNKVVRHLADEAFIERTGKRGFRVIDPEKLLLAWRDVYRFERHERRGYFTLFQGKTLEDALAGLASLKGGVVVYAAFSAAERLAPNVRQPKTWLYLAPSLEEEFRSRLKAKPVDSGENLVVLFPFDESVFYAINNGGKGEKRLPCTNAVQAYADLYYSGGRGQEAAEALLNQILKPAWKQGPGK